MKESEECKIHLIYNLCHKYTNMQKDYKNKLIVVLFFAAALFTALSLSSFHKTDLYFFTSSPNFPSKNYAGIVGAKLSFFLLLTIGFSAYLIPLFCLLLGMDRLRKYSLERENFLFLKIIGSVIFFLCLSSALGREGDIQHGGILGTYFFFYLNRYFNKGAYIIIGVFSLLSFLLIKDIFLFPFFLKLTRKIIRGLFVRLGRLVNKLRRKKEKRKISKYERNVTSKKDTKKPRIKIAPIPLSNKTSLEQFAKEKLPSVSRTYQHPPLSLLKSPPPVEQRKIKDNLQANAKILEETLLDFGIEAKITDINRGPVITRYDILPAPGIKINRIVTLSDNLALAMRAESVRFITHIPGKAAVGIEVPNSSTMLVYCQEILSSEQFQKSDFTIPIGLGKNVSGLPIISDLSEMPHLLIAGATGSGKTVCVNNLIINFTFKFHPDELKLLIIDPKMVELSSFNDIPHLLCPAVTDAKKASLALNWAVGEMERRFQLLASAGTRNIKVYNKKQEKDGRDRLPYIIIIVDELADLMMVAPKEVEMAITRLAQLSRAVGIHIILATQRPSVDVITGVIKANFPARVSFKVASKVDSRTVLDVNGADKLLGNGDMLFLEPGSFKPKRAQGTLIFDEEIERVVHFLKQQQKPVYNKEILEKDVTKQGSVSLEKDELYEEAVKMVLQTKHASVSLLQRKLGIGYSRAARIIDMMEEEGVVGPLVGSKQREILIEK